MPIPTFRPDDQHETAAARAVPITVTGRSFEIIRRQIPEAPDPTKPFRGKFIPSQTRLRPTPRYFSEKISCKY